MNNDKKRLSDFALNIYSQFGEDGIVENIFNIIGTTTKVCVEFGAWDGFHLSNTANLWVNHGWSGILIECDTTRFEQLKINASKYKSVCINAMVGSDDEDSLEAILTREKIFESIDFLSIDVDGDDYHIFESLRKIRPRVIACEYNPTIPSHLALVPRKHNYFGCSSLSLVRLALSKGYDLVAITETNCFFVLREEISKFKNFELEYAKLTTNRHITYVLSGYSGDYVFSREPTYGLKQPLQQEFIIGDTFVPIPPRKSLTEYLKRMLPQKHLLFLKKYKNWRP